MTHPQPHQPAPPPAPSARSGGVPTWLMIAIAAVLLGIVACVCCLAAAFFLRRPILDRIRSAGPGEFRVDPPARDGSVSGAYRYFDSQGGHLARFRVTADGVATFSLDGAPDSETLQVALQDEGSATMSWNGQEWDGDGALAAAERAALEDLLEHDLGHSLSVIPLKAGCRGEDAPTPRQVAALLVPLQMRFKYLVTRRAAELDDLRFHALCEQQEGGEWSVLPSVVQMSAAAPVPVVLGYFPFDEEGAAEEAASRPAGTQLACVEQFPSSIGGPLPDLGGGRLLAADEDEIPFNEYGPCDAMCRGACGADCHPESCEETVHTMCEKDGMGRYTGMEIRVISYTCGVHEGCIEHDLCYDACNAFLGCETWAAAFCRHAQHAGPLLDPSVPTFCDQHAILKHGLSNTSQWVRGQGPQPIVRIFDYSDPDFPPRENHGKCPPETKAEGEKEPAEDLPETVESEEPAVPEPEPPVVQPEPEAPPAQPEREPIDPCDLLPYGGTIGNQHDETNCFKSYSTEPGERTAQVWVYLGQGGSDYLCEKFTEGSDFHTIVGTRDVGDCGFRVEYGYLGEPAPGYDGWGVHFVLDRYQVSISTRTDDYPEHDAWIYMAAEEAEDNIRAYLGLDDD